MLRYCCKAAFGVQNLEFSVNHSTHHPKPINLLRWLLRRGSPLPIPNREVKPACADGTAICGRVCHRLSFKNPSSNDEGFFVFKWVCYDTDLYSNRSLYLILQLWKTLQITMKDFFVFSRVCYNPALI